MINLQKIVLKKTKKINLNIIQIEYNNIIKQYYDDMLRTDRSDRQQYKIVPIVFYNENEEEKKRCYREN